MNKKPQSLTFMCALSLSAVAHAEVYICKDASGRTLTSDRPIMECADRNVRVLGSNGLTQREIAPPMTAEQKHQKLEEENKRKVEAEERKEQQRQDRALMVRYKSENDIEVDRKRTLDQVKEQIKREEAGIASSEKRLKEARAEEAQKGKKAAPAVLQRQIDDAEQSIQDGRKRIAEREAEAAQINAKFDKTMKRYRELNGGVVQTSAALERK